MKGTWKKALLAGALCIGCLQLPAQTDFRNMDYEEALAAAREEGKSVFIDFYTDWCGPCKMMAREVFPQKEVGDYLNSRFVCIQLNAEKEGKELAQSFGVEAYPTFVAVDADGKVLMKKEGGNTADKFIAAIEREIDPEKSPERLAERYAAGERSPQLIKDYAEWKLEEGGHSDAAYEELKQIITDYFEGLSDAEKQSPENLFVYTEYAESPSDPVVKYMVSHRDEFSAAMKDTVMSHIFKIYEQEVYNYLCVLVPYNEAEYQSVKQTVNELGMNDTHAYDLSFKLIEEHAKGNPAAFLALCKKLYPKLNNDQRFYLMAGFSRLIDTDDVQIRHRAARFVRSQLAGMEIRLLFFIAPVLSELERE